MLVRVDPPLMEPRPLPGPASTKSVTVDQAFSNPCHQLGFKTPHHEVCTSHVQPGMVLGCKAVGVLCPSAVVACGSRAGFQMP